MSKIGGAVQKTGLRRCHS